MALTSFDIAAGIAFLVIGFLFLRTKQGRDIQVFPPGPAPLPFIGNLSSMPIQRPWLKFTEWKKNYGGLVHLTIFQEHILVINSAKVADDLLEKQSKIFSDRPILPMIEFLGGGFAVPMLPYADRWKKHRSLLQQKFRAGAVSSYHALEINRTQRLLRRLLDNPSEFRTHLKNFAGGITMHVAYGYQPSEGPDRMLELAEKMTITFNDILFKSLILRFFPALQSFLEWLPFSGFTAFAHKTREMVKETLDAPFEFVKRGIVNGTALQCFTSDQLEILASGAQEEKGISEDFIKETSANIYTAGTDTMNAALNSFILEMVLHQDKQKRAQEEIDSIIGRDRLPDFGDRHSLPYVEAIYRELLRHRPVTPLALPHALTEDYIYGDFFLPAGSSVIANVWALTRDEDVYPEPESFKPERFLQRDGTLNDDTLPVTYGFGRRLCVGRYLAEDVLWIAFASILSVFDITHAKDSDGKKVEVHDLYPDNTISLLPPFKCSITPRNEMKKKLIEMLDAF